MGERRSSRAGAPPRVAAVGAGITRTALTQRGSHVPRRSSGDSPRRSPSQGAARRAFTLIESALAIVIVGVGVLAMVGAQQAFHMKNAWSTHASTGTWLANELREMTFNLPRHDPVTGTQTWGPEANELSVEDFDDVDDFDGSTGDGLIFSAALGNGPVNARREIIANMPGWSQTVRVYNIDPHDIYATPDESNDGMTDMMLVEVLVEYQGPNDNQPWDVVRMKWISPK